MIEKHIENLLSLNLGFNLKYQEYTLRSLDNGSFVINSDIDDCMEEEFESDELSKAVKLFLTLVGPRL